MEEGRLTNHQTVTLARAISQPAMESIALGYLGIEQETIDSYRAAHRENTEAFNREILRLWRNKHGGDDQIQILAEILYQSARDGGYINPSRVQEILGIPAPRTLTRTKDIKEKKKYYSKRQFKRLIRKLKKSTAEVTKAETELSIQDKHVTEMDALCTGLTIEKLDNSTVDNGNTTVSDYKEIFSDVRTQYGGKYSRNLTCLNPEEEGERILVKGEHGMETDIISKKVAHDWAKGHFKIFKVIFIIDLKSVEPEDLIENVLLYQSPVLKRLGLKPSELRYILDAYGSRSLLILDGLDENHCDKNSNVMRIISGEKFHHCHVLVTSQSRRIRDFERYFTNIVSVNGFTHRGDIEKFSGTFLNEPTLLVQKRRCIFCCC